MVQQSKIAKPIGQKNLDLPILFFKFWHCLSQVVDFSYLFARTIHYKCMSEIQVFGLSGQNGAVFSHPKSPVDTKGHENTAH